MGGLTMRRNEFQSLNIEEAVHCAAADDAQMAEAALEGFEDRVLERMRRDRRAAALNVDTTENKGGRWRMAFGFSLALNVCAVALFGVFFFQPGAPERWMVRQSMTLPAGMADSNELTRAYGELESFFGDRLNWVAECNGKLAMGIINDPDKIPEERGASGPLVALVYWLDATDGTSKERLPDPVVILTRPGRSIRERIPMAETQAPVEIAVDSFTRRRGAFAIQTEVRPVAAELDAGRKNATSLAAKVDLHPGQPVKLGEVRLGDQTFDTFLAVQLLNEAGSGNGLAL